MVPRRSEARGLTPLVGDVQSYLTILAVPTTGFTCAWVGVRHDYIYISMSDDMPFCGTPIIIISGVF